ncbi:30S ribosomal protein S9 [Candidatus Woesearchaeota archaeon]|nr:MAG: 30S ribosomal protein S9 [Candidatus Woesearchaeota archaeon]
MKQPIITSGFRKQAVARANLKEGSGIVRINSQPLDYYGTAVCRMKIKEPLMLVPDIANKVDITVRVSGGGQMGQTEAVRLAIGRALSEYGGETTRKILQDYDRALLVADTRYKETRKPNDSKARAKRQKSYR